MSRIPSEPPAEVLAFNARVADQTRNVPPVWEVGAAAGRQAREEGKSLLGPPRLSPRASVPDHRRTRWSYQASGDPS